MAHPHWPLFDLVIRTPRVTLRYLDDALGDALAALAAGGVHDPGFMPFTMPWTDVPSPELERNALRFYWSSRAASTPENWSVPFMVRRQGVLVGMQELSGKNFAVTRTVGTGSWVGQAFQGQGIGTEMRSAVLQFAFDHLKAERADSGAFTDNPRSLAVSRALGYRPDGTVVLRRRPGERAVEQRLTVDPSTFVRPDWMVQFRGLSACLPYFGL